MSPLRTLTTRLAAPHVPHTPFHTARALPRPPMGGVIESGMKFPEPKPIEKGRITTQQPENAPVTEEVAKKQIPIKSDEHAEAIATFYGSTRGEKMNGC